MLTRRWRTQEQSVMHCSYCWHVQKVWLRKCTIFPGAASAVIAALQRLYHAPVNDSSKARCQPSKQSSSCVQVQELEALAPKY